MRRRSQLGKTGIALAIYGPLMCGLLCAGAQALEPPQSPRASTSPGTGVLGTDRNVDLVVAQKVTEPLALIERAQRALDTSDLHAASKDFAAAIQALDDHENVNPPALIEALVGLASAMNGLHQYEESLAPARRALMLIRSRNGLYAEQQRRPLELLIDAESQLAQIDAASDDLKLLERMSAATQASDPIRHAVMLTRVGEWHCRLGGFVDGRDRHRRAIEALEGVGAEESLVRARLALARCSLHELSSQGIRTIESVFEEYRGPIVRTSSFNGPTYRHNVNRGLRNEGESAIRDAARTALESATLSARTKLDTLLFAGDWFQLKGFTNTARDYYAHAGKVVGSNQSGDDRLDVPVRVLYAIPPMALRAYRQSRPERSERFIVVEFTVREDGSVQTPRVIERNVTKSMVDETLDAIRTARYRPRVVDGAPVESRKVVLRQSFDDPRELSSSVAYSNAE